jgi:tRNA dimethylallyltransferase
MQKIVIICGPTSSGKTSLALKVAKEFNAEIISADSRQVYRDLDIGTNKGILRQDADNLWYQDGIAIHLVNIRNPSERYSVYDFQNDCEAKIDHIKSRGKNVLLVGGTGLYIDSIYRNYILTDSFENKYDDLNVNELKALYQEKYPEEFQQLNYSDQNNPRRLSMHLSKLDAGVELNISADLGMNKDREYIFIYPEFNREELRQRIEARVDEMFNEGLVKETEEALKNYGNDSVALRGIGYKEVVEYLDGKYSLEECIKFVKNSHNQYAKRQITWFEGIGRKYPLKRVASIDDTMELVRDFLSD